MANPKTANPQAEFTDDLAAKLLEMQREAEKSAMMAAIQEQQRQASMWITPSMYQVPSTSLMPSTSMWTAMLGATDDFKREPPKPSVDADVLAKLKTAEPYKVGARMPDLVECVTGWRAWKVVNGAKGPRLTAVGMSGQWQPKKAISAKCKVSGGHPAPAFDCSCGVWAFKDMDKLVEAVGTSYGRIRVLGQVSLWGKVIETENGWRAEKAYPKELWLLDGSLEELGMVYDVPVRTAG